MSATVNGSKCGTCEYWSGNRITCMGGRAAQVSSTSDKAVCLYKTASKTLKHPANKAGCPRYVKWSQLR